MDELVKIGKTLEGKEQVVSKLKAFLNDEQKRNQMLLWTKYMMPKLKIKQNTRKVNLKAQSIK